MRRSEIKAVLGPDDPETWSIVREIRDDFPRTALSIVVAFILLFSPSLFTESERDYPKGETPPGLERWIDALRPTMRGWLLAGTVILLYLLFVVPTRQRNRARIRVAQSVGRMAPRDRVRFVLPIYTPSIRKVGDQGTHIELRFSGATIHARPGKPSGVFKFQGEIFPTDGRDVVVTSDLAEQLREAEDEEFNGILPNPYEAKGRHPRDLVLLVRADESLQAAFWCCDIQLRITEVDSGETTLLHVVEEPIEGTWAQLKAQSIADSEVGQT